MTEQQVIEQLSQYRQKQARIQVLSTYSVGAGITVSRLNQEDQLQELHRKLKGKPSYMYLSQHEQQLETTAHAYLTRYPSGIKSQLQAIPKQGADAEDDKLLQELRSKIKKVIAARGYEIRDDLDSVLDRLVELQELQEEIKHIDKVLEALAEYKPDYARLIRLRYVDELPAGTVATEMGIAERTFRSWRMNAIKEFIRIAA